jgi:hypothetical protein
VDGGCGVGEAKGTGREGREGSEGRSERNTRVIGQSPIS